MSTNLFDAAYYSAANPDLAAAGLTNYQQLFSHFQNFGINEGRAFSSLVDLNFYKLSNSDLAAAGLTTDRQLYDHLQNFGVAENRRFSRLVNLDYYLVNNQDVNSAFGGSRERAFEHLQNIGVAEGRVFSPFFNAGIYLQKNPDLSAARFNNRQAFEHFIGAGLSEARSSFLGFSEAGYLAANPDVRQAVNQNIFRSGLEHYINFGASEGRLLKIFQNPNPEGTFPFFVRSNLTIVRTEGGFDFFGSSIASIGNNVAIGAPFDDLGAFESGIAYLFDTTTGNVLQTFKNPNPGSNDQFGTSIAAVGNNIAIGARFDNSNFNSLGTVYLFDPSGNLLQSFKNPYLSSGSSINTGFGTQLAAIGNNILIAAPNEANSGGAVYQFDSVTGNLLRTFQDPTPGDSSSFGSSIAVLGNNILIGAPLEDAGATDSGNAYLFDGVTGNLLRVFPSPNPQNSANFGATVATVGNNFLVAAPNAGAVYLLDGRTGTLLQTFQNPSLGSNDNFGSKMTAIGNNVLIAAPYASTGLNAVLYGGTGAVNTGAAYLFDTTNGNLVRSFFNPDPQNNENFGSSLAAIGDRIAIGTPYNTVNNLSTGSVYLF